MSFTCPGRLGWGTWPSGTPAIGADHFPGGLVVVVAGQEHAGKTFRAGDGEDLAQRFGGVTRPCFHGTTV